MPLHSSLLYHFVRDSLGSYSEDFRIIERENPTLVRLNGRTYSVRVSYVHDSGNTRPNEDEVRIQISRNSIETQRDRNQAGTHVAFIGFFDGGRAFVGWDPRHVFSLQARTVVSVYARRSQQRTVTDSQAAVHQFRSRFLTRPSFAIALPASALGFYLENIDGFHSLSSKDAIVNLVNSETSAFAHGQIGRSDILIIKDGLQRHKFEYTRKAYPRDPKFTESVLAAYQHTCCVCGRQLGIVQAAHIIPHSEPDSPNTVQNGLALCVEHHRLYDDALLLPGPHSRLTLNRGRAEYLRLTNQGKGLESIEKLDGHFYQPPPSVEQGPCAEYLERGLAIRMAGQAK